MSTPSKPAKPTGNLPTEDRAQRRMRDPLPISAKPKAKAKPQKRTK
jgi:hypothetical protein